MELEVIKCEYTLLWDGFYGNTRKMDDDLKKIILTLCESAGANKNEVQFFDDLENPEPEGQSWDPWYRFYFRNHEFTIKLDFYESYSFEELNKSIGDYFSLTVTEIEEKQEFLRKEKERRNKIKYGNSTGWYNYRPTGDEDKCTGEYGWNID
jgi:hypothetical protein